MPNRFSHPVTRQIVAFLVSVGIPVVAAESAGQEFLPGIRIRGGALVVDDSRLTWPGDLLHEAAHLSMTPSHRRGTSEEDASEDGGEELGSIAWSWAALCHLGLDPEIVFHSGGYRGGSQSIIENFREGRYIGVPFLQWIGLTTEHQYPKMIKWLRD